jgi:hypothetical protein
MAARVWAPVDAADGQWLLQLDLPGIALHCAS